MPETAFMTIKSWIRTAAERLEIPLSSRQAHKVTNVYVWILSAEEYDRLHEDPTGETAVKNVMAWMQNRAAA